MKWILPLIFIALIFSGCSNKPTDRSRYGYKGKVKAVLMNAYRAHWKDGDWQKLNDGDQIELYFSKSGDLDSQMYISKERDIRNRDIHVSGKDYQSVTINNSDTVEYHYFKWDGNVKETISKDSNNKRKSVSVHYFEDGKIVKSKYRWRNNKKRWQKQSTKYSYNKDGRRELSETKGNDFTYTIEFEYNDEDEYGNHQELIETFLFDEGSTSETTTVREIEYEYYD